MASNTRIKRYLGLPVWVCVIGLAVAACGGGGAESTGSTITVTADVSPPATPTQVASEPPVESDDSLAAALLLTDADFDSVSAGAYGPFVSELTVLMGPLAPDARVKAKPEPCGPLGGLGYYPTEDAKGTIVEYATRSGKETNPVSGTAQVTNSSIRIFESEAEARKAFSAALLSVIYCDSTYSVSTGSNEDKYETVFETFILDNGSEVGGDEVDAMAASTVWITRPQSSYVFGLVGDRIWSLSATSQDASADAELARIRALIPLAQAAAARQ